MERRVITVRYEDHRRLREAWRFEGFWEQQGADNSDGTVTLVYLRDVTPSEAPRLPEPAP